jgi:hypothetical protein
MLIQSSLNKELKNEKKVVRYAGRKRRNSTVCMQTDGSDFIVRNADILFQSIIKE